MNLSSSSLRVALDFWVCFFRCILNHFDIFFFHKEPIGSVSPKVNAVDELNVVRGGASKTLSLLCPAQAYPTPVFRYIKIPCDKLINYFHIWIVLVWVTWVIKNGDLKKRNLYIQNQLDQLVRRSTLETAQFFEKKPVRQSISYVLHKLSQLRSLGKMIKSLKILNVCVFLRLDLNWTWNFENLIWKNNILEPIGSVAPKVNSGDDLKAVKAEMSKSITLLCPAQAYPMPVFRLVHGYEWVVLSLVFFNTLSFDWYWWLTCFSLRRTYFINFTKDLFSWRSSHCGSARSSHVNSVPSSRLSST